MGAVLLIAHTYPRLEELRQALGGALELWHTASILQGKKLLAAVEVSVLVLDCAGDREMEYGLLRWVEENQPQTECIALVHEADFCPIHATRKRNLFRLLKPVEPAELADRILRTIQKVERAASLAADPVLLRRVDQQFWLHLLSGTVPPSEEGLRQAAHPASFRYQEGQQALFVLLCLRRWHGELPPRVLDDHRFAARNLARRTLLQGRPGCSFSWIQDTLAVVLYGPDLPAEEDLRRSCGEIADRCAQWFGCDLSCYFGTPCPAYELPAQAHRLLQGDMDNVTNARAVLSLAQTAQKKEPLSLPVLRDWMPYFIDGREEEFCRCIEDYFQQAIAANNMDRAFLARFQQDFIQELGFALKNAGIPLHSLFSGTDELLRMEQAIRYVPDMLAWVRACAKKAIDLSRPEQAGKTVAQRVKDYINHRLIYPFSREELARALQLSEGHIARSFRQETGMSISDYLARERIKLACRTIRQTGLSLNRVAEQCGFHDYPYFYKTFKKYTGLSPAEFQEKKPEIEI